MKPKALEHLIEKSKFSRNMAGKSLAEALTNESEISQQLRALETYRGEYSNKLQALLANGATLPIIRSYQQFLCSLDKAIQDARYRLSLQKNAVADSHIEMQKCQKRFYSFDTLKHRQLKKAQVADQRKEAKLEDEISATAFRKTGDLAPNKY